MHESIPRKIFSFFFFPFSWYCVLLSLGYIKHLDKRVWPSACWSIWMCVSHACSLTIKEPSYWGALWNLKACCGPVSVEHESKFCELTQFSISEVPRTGNDEMEFMINFRLERSYQTWMKFLCFLKSNKNEQMIEKSGNAIVFS